MPDAFPDLGPIRFRRHRDAGDVISATFAFLRANAKELAKTYLVVVLPLALATGVALVLYMGQVAPLMSDPYAIGEDDIAAIGGTYLGLILFSLFGAALMLATAGAYVRLYREGQTGDLTAGELWEEAKGLILPYVGLMLAYSAAVVLTIWVVVVPCLGALAWVAFALWLMPRVAVTMAVRAVERPTLGASWARAGDLVKGSWGFAFGALFLAAGVYAALMFAASIPSGIAMALLEANTAQDPSVAMTTMSLLFAPLQVVSYAGYLIPLLAVFFVHGRLVEELEGTSLGADLDALAGEARMGASDAFRSTRPAPPSTPPAADVPEADTPDDGDDAPPSGFRGGGFSG